MTYLSLSMLGIALSVSTLFGYVITASLLPCSTPRRFIWTLTPAVGLGICSMIFFLFRRPMFTVESTLAAAACWYLYRRKDNLNLFHAIGRPSLFTLVLFGALGLAAAGVMIEVDRTPHGQWDGWAIWNTHARFLERDGQNWKNDIQYSFHGDYPLLAPAVTARFWRYAGQEVPEAGALLGIILALSAIAVLATTVSELRDSYLGMLLALILVGTPFYVDLATSQYADVPLSFFILSTIALLCLHSEREPHSGTMVLAGFTAGCAGWTKNEGLLFIGATCAALLFPVIRTRWKALRQFLFFFAGLALPLFVIVLFKLSVSTQNDLIENQHDTIGKILDLSRHTVIIQQSIATFGSFAQWSVSPYIPLVAFVLFRGIDRRCCEAPAGSEV